jgi:hypothetical protein
MYKELKDQLRHLETNYNGKVFWNVLNQVKRDKINDDELLEQIAKISQKRFRERVSFTLNIPLGNLLAIVITIAAIGMAFFIKSDWIFYICAFVLMATLHPLSHYMTGCLMGIRFTHYYLNGPARFEPALKIDYFSYLKASGKSRALMHVSGVMGTVVAPLVAVAIALNRGADTAAGNLFIIFLILIVFELLTSTKAGDLMRARREYGYRPRI